MSDWLSQDDGFSPPTSGSFCLQALRSRGEAVLRQSGLKAAPDNGRQAEGTTHVLEQRSSVLSAALDLYGLPSSPLADPGFLPPTSGSFCLQALRSRGEAVLRQSGL
eukprot:TRINITY_DN1437_c0_g1_i1.p1 TRINITY_DN1437_c0_g1~~TRINITY_DN1437_c0_g1_i1.p1  ORF type:complete len:107 (+),score=23.82 TRINITY_DN1437_c0_g1_i1:60-380(+)